MSIDTLFGYVMRQKTDVIRYFRIIYFALLVYMFFGSWAVATDQSFSRWILQLSLRFGDTALVLFTVTMIPGIAKRFGIHHKSISIIRIFRRYIGILVFICAFTHAWFQRILFSVLGFGSGLMPFELIGLVALILLFPLFLTSNDWSVNTLGPLWYLLHTLVYVIMWFILLHVSMVRLSIWSVVAASLVIVQVISFVYDYIQKKQSLVPK